MYFYKKPTRQNNVIRCHNKPAQMLPVLCGFFYALVYTGCPIPTAATMRTLLLLLLGMCACAARVLPEATEGSDTVEAYRTPPEGCASIVSAIDLLNALGDRGHALWSTASPTTEKILTYEIDAGIQALATVGQMTFCDLSEDPPTEPMTSTI